MEWLLFTVALFQSAGAGVSAFVQPIPFHSTGHHRTSSFGSGTPQLQTGSVSFHVLELETLLCVRFAASS